MQSAVEEKTLLWVDSSNRERGGATADYTIKLTEPLHNVVGMRVIEALIPATTLSIEGHNDTMVLHTVFYDDVAPVGPKYLLQAHTVGFDGQGWRSHDRISPVKTPYFDIGQDVEHHVVARQVPMYRSKPENATDIGTVTLEGASEYVICVFEGNVVHALPEGVADRAIYDPEDQMTVLSCRLHEDLMDYLTTVTFVSGVYQIPNGKYDSLRDFVYETEHGYSNTKQGIKLDFIRSQTDKPERRFKLQINPKNVWVDVVYDAAGGSYTHDYIEQPNGWCAMWLGSTCLDPLGFTGPYDQDELCTTAGGEFITSDPEPRYNGLLRAKNLVNLAADRYVWLRCAEVEQHMCAGTGQIMQRGIGVFKLDAPGVYKEAKTEFISVIPPSFHPIAKLHQLSFRFEIGAKPGQLYDFKSISHFMLVSIVSLKADKQVIYKSLPKQLNPDYEPNALMYRLKWDRANECGTSGRPALTDQEERDVIRIHNATLRGVELFANAPERRR